MNLNRSLSVRDLAFTVSFISMLAGTGFWLWWRGIGPFKSLDQDSAGKHIYFTYEQDKSAIHKPSILAYPAFGSDHNLIALRNYDKSIPLNKSFWGKLPENNTQPLLNTALDSEIRKTIRVSLRDAGFKATDLTSDGQSVFWSAQSIKPIHLVVRVQRRFEGDKCIFLVVVKLQRAAVLPKMKNYPTYATASVQRSDVIQVPPEKATDAITQQVNTMVLTVLRAGLGVEIPRSNKNDVGGAKSAPI